MGLYNTGCVLETESTVLKSHQCLVCEGKMREVHLKPEAAMFEYYCDTCGYVTVSDEAQSWVDSNIEMKRSYIRKLFDKRPKDKPFEITYNMIWP
jgi:hypothetical protein